MSPDIAVIIVTYNSADVIGDLLDSLPAALGELSADVPMESVSFASNQTWVLPESPVAENVQGEPVSVASEE